MTDPVGQLADAISGAPPTAVLRIGKVTALEAGPGSRARLDVTGTAWLGLDTDARIGVGDRVYALQQGSVWVVVGKLTGTPVPAVPIGALTLWAGAATAVPAGWLLADGQALSRTDFPDLFAAIGTTYGAPDLASFNLPNLADRMPLGAGTRAAGVTGGSETVVLTTAQLPSHGHSFTGSPHNHTQDPHSHSVRDSITVASGTGSTVMDDTTGTANGTGSATATNNSATAGGTVGATGSGDPHPNLPPFLTLRFILRAL